MTAAEPRASGAREKHHAPAPRVGVIEREHDLIALLDEWYTLWERCPWSTPFQCPGWQLAWWRHLGGGDLRVITLRSGERLVGLAPFFLHDSPSAPRQISLLGTGNSDYDDVLFDPDLGYAGADVVLRALAAMRGEWRTCELDELRAESPLLRAQIPPALRAEIAPSSVCPILPLRESFDALRPGMTATHRRKLRLCYNRVSRAGGATLELAGRDSVRELLDVLTRLHERRWREQGSPGVLADPRVLAMHHEVAPELLAHGCLRLYALRLDGARVAVLYGMAWRGRMYCYLTGIDPEARYYSPGVALLGAVIEQAIVEGMHEADFLRGAEPYKYLWGARDSQSHVLRLYHE